MRPAPTPELDVLVGPLSELAEAITADADLTETARHLFRVRETASALLRETVLSLAAERGLAANRIAAITGLGQSTVSRWIKEDRADPGGWHARHAAD